jgi:hypothetical protein
MSDTDTDKLYAVKEADALMLRMLLAVGKVDDQRPTRYHQTSAPLRQGLEICLKVHRTGGISSEQMKQMERSLSTIEKLLEGNGNDRG